MGRLEGNLMTASFAGLFGAGAYKGHSVRMEIDRMVGGTPLVPGTPAYQASEWLWFLEMFGTTASVIIGILLLRDVMHQSPRVRRALFED